MTKKFGNLRDAILQDLVHDRRARTLLILIGVVWETFLEEFPETVRDNADFKGHLLEAPKGLPPSGIQPTSVPLFELRVVDWNRLRRPTWTYVLSYDHGSPDKIRVTGPVPLGSYIIDNSPQAVVDWFRKKLGLSWDVVQPVIDILAKKYGLTGEEWELPEPEPEPPMFGDAFDFGFEVT